ncbi:MAG: amidohydrolase family protein, partial [Alphaproteobacteria bacterium]|nr:amidohydrolase family protein [Alphaproteobacteria bacterium]
SDYFPQSLLHGAFLLARAPVAMPLAAAVATVSATPADSVGLADRGRIETGRRADLVRVREIQDLPLVRAVWRAGERVA